MLRYAFADLARLRAAVELPIAGGENNPALHEFRTMLTDAAYDILQPEVMVVGGPTEMRRIATLAAAFGRRTGVEVDEGSAESGGGCP